MGKVSKVLTSYLIRRNVIPEEKRNIYLYGFQIGLEVTLNTIISVLIAFLCHMVWETIIFFAVFIVLRSYAGGLHLNTYIACLICSCMSLFGILLIVKYTDIGQNASLGCIYVLLPMIKLVSPVEDINRTVRLEDRIEFGRKLNYSILGILIASVLLFLLDMGRSLYTVVVTLSFMLSILILGKIKYKSDVRKFNKNSKAVDKV